MQPGTAVKGSSLSLSRWSPPHRHWGAARCPEALSAPSQINPSPTALVLPANLTECLAWPPRLTALDGNPDRLQSRSCGTPQCISLQADTVQWPLPLSSTTEPCIYPSGGTPTQTLMSSMPSRTLRATVGSLAKANVNDIPSSPLIQKSDHFITQSNQLVQAWFTPDPWFWLSQSLSSPSCTQGCAPRGHMPWLSQGAKWVWLYFLKTGVIFAFLQLLGISPASPQPIKNAWGWPYMDISQLSQQH